MLGDVLWILVLIWLAAAFVGVATTLAVVVVAIHRRRVPDRWLAIFGLLLSIGAGAAAWVVGGAELTYGGRSAFSYPLWAGGQALAFASSIALCVLNLRFLRERI